MAGDGIYVAEIYLECDDTTDPEKYASDCLGFVPIEVVAFPTADASTAYCAFTPKKSGVYKVYKFQDWGWWVRVATPPNIVQCPEPEEPVRPRLLEPIDLEPPAIREEISISLCLEKIEQWQRNPRVMQFPSVRHTETALLPSLENLEATRIRSALSQQRRGLRGGVGSRRINLAGRNDLFDALIQTIYARRYRNIHIAQRGNRLALCFTTRSNRTHFLSSVGYRELLRELSLKRRPLK